MSHQIKREMRRRLRAERAAVTDTHGRAFADAVMALPYVRTAKTVTCYVSVGPEPATRDLLEALDEAGIRVLLPVTLPDLDLDWAEHTDDLRPAGFGLLEPTGPRLGTGAVAEVDVVLAPALAVDPRGSRLGQGGGCYDRALARVPGSTPVVALVHDHEVVDEVPSEPHDRAVTTVVTPTRTFDCRP